MMKRFSLLLFIAANILMGCQDDDEQKNATLVVTVSGFSSAAQATVFTKPSTTELKTDQFGQVKFQAIPKTTYEVYAYVPGQGSGKTTVLLNAPLVHADVEMLSGVMIEPVVDIRKPGNLQGFAVGETVVFEAKVSDNTSQMSALEFSWESSKDGKLGAGSVTGDGTATLSVSNLSKNVHVLRLVVKNSLGAVGKDSITINTLSPKTPVLSATKVNSMVKLTWTAETTSDFESFQLYRFTKDFPTPQLVTTIGSAATKSFDDPLQFTDSVFYFLKAFNMGGYNSQSSTVKLKAVTLHAVEPVQALLRPNSTQLFVRTASNHIVVYDYTTSEVVRDVDMGVTIGFFDIGSNGFGEELYVPRSDGWIYIYDATTFQLKGQLSVGVAAKSVTTDNNGIIFASVSPSPWWEQPLRTYKRSDLSFIAGGGDFDNCRVKLLPSNNEIIEISTSISPIDMDYYAFSAGTFTSHSNDLYHGDHPLDANIFRIAPAKSYLVTASEGAVYNANSGMNFIGLLPRSGGSFRDFEFSVDASFIYGGYGTKRSVEVFNYPGLTKNKEYLTGGYPLYIFRKGTQLISISTNKASEGYYNWTSKIGFEIIDIQ